MAPLVTILSTESPKESKFDGMTESPITLSVTSRPSQDPRDHVIVASDQVIDRLGESNPPVTDISAAEGEMPGGKNDGAEFGPCINGTGNELINAICRL
jgi:hypothetical protein